MSLLLSYHQLWVAIIGALVPGIAYLVNHHAPWISEPIKAAVFVVVAAASSALYAALATNVFGWNDATLQLVVTGVVTALAAHFGFWKPSTVAARLGAGSNAA